MLIAYIRFADDLYTICKHDSFSTTDLDCADTGSLQQCFRLCILVLVHLFLASFCKAPVALSRFLLGWVSSGMPPFSSNLLQDLATRPARGWDKRGSWPLQLSDGRDTPRPHTKPNKHNPAIPCLPFKRVCALPWICRRGTEGRPGLRYPRVARESITVGDR